MTDVMEYTLVNRVIREVMDTGPGVASKLDRKFMTRRMIQEMLEVLVMEEVPAEVSRKTRIMNQEAKRTEWAARWAALEMELIAEMDILTELENAKMDVEEQEEEFRELLEDIEMEEVEYEDWLIRELKEMGISWIHRRARWVLPYQARFKTCSCFISNSSKNQEFIQTTSRFQARS